MKKGYSLLIALLITCFIFILIHPHNEDVGYLEKVKIKRVIDGDTFVSFDDRTFRLANINSPEKGMFGYKYSLDFLSKLINKTVEIKSISLDNTGKREVAQIYYETQYINLELVRLGLSPKAWVEETELKIFDDAEKGAVEKEIGLWKKSSDYGCLNVSLNAEKEELFLKNLCKTNIINWTIKDESREFFIINKNLRELVIKSGDFSDRKGDNYLFWKEQNIWNNDRDTIYIFDSNNNIVYYSSYGYH